jgi:6-phosphogluconolactonase
MGTVDLRRLASAAELARTAAKDWVETAARFASTQDLFSVALSGGRVAQAFLSEVAEQLKVQPAWLSRVHFFWSDERCVPPDDSESNFHLANVALLKPLNLPSRQIHRIEGEKPPSEACVLAEAELRRVVGAERPSVPMLDLILLGMGEDGHVASLFPGEPEDAVNSQAVFREVTAVKPPPLRITMGYRVIAAARRAWVLASGAGKQAALSQSLKPESVTPLARVLQARSSTRLYSDITS